jgi:hypothetical protein
MSGNNVVIISNAVDSNQPLKTSCDIVRIMRSAPSWPGCSSPSGADSSLNARRDTASPIADSPSPLAGLRRSLVDTSMPIRCPASFASAGPTVGSTSPSTSD